jgi:TonB-dependent starch-binding outer membrane protein SusC
MKKTVVKQRLLIRLMKMTLYQFVLALIFSTVTLANSLNGQGKLDTKVTISISEVNLNKALAELGKTADVKFSYNSRMVSFDQKVTVEAENEMLSAVLSRVLKPLNIVYTLVSNQIVLQKTNAKSESDNASNVALSEDQQRLISGVVLDANGLSLPGATVLVKGTTNSVSTDIDGKFTIKVDNTDAILVISYIGFDIVEIAVANKSDLKITLKESSQTLNEVVVVGYGTSKKIDLTGAVASANIKDFEKSPNTNIVQSLQGAVPGLNIGQVTSAGATPDIQIRGRNTISGNTSVLIVIDGIVSGNLSSLNPADIESVNVLKDASATAIYGASASNGVMLITTKKGKAGKTRVNFASSYSVQNPTHNYSTMNREQYLSFLKNLMWNKAYTEESGYIDSDPSFVLANYLPVTTMATNGVISETDFNWWDVATRQAYINENKISISGGGDNTSYLISYGNTTQKNFLVNDDFERNTIRLNLDTKINSWWKLGMQTSGSFVNQDGSEPILWTLYGMNPLVTPYKADGTINPYPMENSMGNPLMGNNINDRERHTYFTGNLYSEFQLPIKGLTYRINYGNNYVINTHYQANPYGNSQTGEVYKEFSTVYNHTIDNIVNFSRDFGRNSFGATLVYGFAKGQYSYTKADATDFTNLTLGYNSLELGTNKFVFSDANSSSSLYQVGRFNYKYNDRYLLTATVRRDGSSSFAENHKTAIFPSAALGWIISKENFFANLLPEINYFKLRVGYGVTGNSIGSYSSLAKVTTGPGYVFGDGSEAVIRQELSSMENKALKWEKTGGFNVGIDFNLLNDRIQGSLDAYKTKTTDLLYAVSIPTITGFNSITSNIGSLQNKGIEFTVTSHNIVAKDFEWSTTFNISSNKNKILSLTGKDGNNDGKEDDLLTSGLFIGQPLGAVYGYKVDGIYQIGDEIPTGYYAGNYKIRDVSGDGIISTDDRTILGNTNPAYRLSLMNKFSYKNFSFSFFINSVQGGKDGYLGENTYSLIQDNSARGNNHIYEFVNNIWSPSNPDGIYSASTSSGAITPYRYEQRNFVRLQDITFGYDLPKSIVSDLGIDNVNLYITGKNLLNFTNWHGWDPEANYGSITPMYNLSASSISKSGSDYDGRPVMKSFTLGLNVSF